MADLPPAFKPDIEAALRLVISAVAQMASQTAHGVPRNLQLAQNLLDPPVPVELPTETWGDKLIVTDTTPTTVMLNQPPVKKGGPSIDAPEPDTPTP